MLLLLLLLMLLMLMLMLELLKLLLLELPLLLLLLLLKLLLLKLLLLLLLLLKLLLLELLPGILLVSGRFEGEEATFQGQEEVAPPLLQLSAGVGHAESQRLQHLNAVTPISERMHRTQESRGVDA